MSVGGNKPLVSIGMPVYKGEDLITDALEHLLAQDMPDFELIISDNASPDNTGMICQRYAARDSRIRYYRNPRNLGACANFEHVARLAKGEYFMWASYDDLWSANFISKCVEAIEASPHVVLAYPQSVVILPDGKDKKIVADRIDTRGITSVSLRVRAVHYGVYYRTAIYGMMKTRIVRSLLPLPRVLGPDHVFLVLLATLGEFSHIPEPLFVWRMQSHLRFRWRSRELYAHYQRTLEPEAKWIAKYKYYSYWPTAATICKRVFGMPLNREDKVGVCVETLKWCILQEIVNPAKRLLFNTAGQILTRIKSH
jgi:glycosyltransferase involved in cell wall biosynthesis